MNARLQQLYERLDRDTNVLLQRLQVATPQRLNEPPKPGKWSVCQIVDHLIAAEEASLRYMQKKSLGMATLHNSGVAEEPKMLVLKVSQRVPLRYQAPPMLAQSPPARTLPELARRWHSVRADLHSFLENIADHDVHKLIYKHPIAGRLNVLHAISFTHEHLRHHLPQIERQLS